jgi:hypothetical protein
MGGEFCELSLRIEVVKFCGLNTRVHAGGQLGVSHFKECGSNGPGD